MDISIEHTDFPLNDSIALRCLGQYRNCRTLLLAVIEGSEVDPWDAAVATDEQENMRNAIITGDRILLLHKVIQKVQSWAVKQRMQLLKYKKANLADNVPSKTVTPNILDTVPIAYSKKNPTQFIDFLKKYSTTDILDYFDACLRHTLHCIFELRKLHRTTMIRNHLMGLQKFGDVVWARMSGAVDERKKEIRHAKLNAAKEAAAHKKALAASKNRTSKKKRRSLVVAQKSCYPFCRVIRPGSINALKKQNKAALD